MDPLVMVVVVVAVAVAAAVAAAVAVAVATFPRSPPDVPSGVRCDIWRTQHWLYYKWLTERTTQ
jgi:hypothetical protein